MLYADDTTIYHSCQDSQQLQDTLSNDLSIIANWLKTNHLQMNVTKTKLLLLARRSRVQELDRVKLSVNDVEHRDDVKFLGVVIDSELNWEKHVAAVRKKCFGGLATLRRLRNTLPVRLKSGLFNALIRPYLDYCSVVWQECSKAQQGKIEQIQNYGMRQILSMPPQTPSEPLRGILGWNQLAKAE